MEETWPNNQDQPVLFLGDWCKIYKKKDRWAKLNSRVVTYHWNDRNKLHQDYLFLSKLYEITLKNLAGELNTFHGVNHTLRYWRILVGPWLSYFIPILFDRWFVISTAISKYSISSARVLRRSPYELVPNNMEDWISPAKERIENSFIGDAWNEMICGQLLKKLKVPIKELPKNHKTKKSNKSLFQEKLKRATGLLLNYLQGIISLQTDHFLTKIPTPIINSIKLQFLLRQIPKIWVFSSVTPLNSEQISRSWFLKRGPTETKHKYKKFINILHEMIPHHIPASYLEGYKKLCAYAKKSPWPQTPKTIFDSELWIANDLFKVWAAQRTENGCPLIIGQHGGSYGISRWNSNEDHQIAISNKYFTWGWRKKNCQNIVPTGILKNFPKQVSYCPHGYALMVQACVPRYSYHMYSLPVGTNQFEKYLKNQWKFVDALPKKLRKELLVRLYPEDYQMCQKHRWKKKFPEISLDPGKTPIMELLKGTRLYISTYNATTFLESLSMNFPTLIFWDRNYWEIRKSAEKPFENLEAAGIFFTSPEKAAQQMIKIWENTKDWWESSDVQNARDSFCKKYAFTPKNSLNIIAQILKKTALEFAGRQKNQK